MSRPNGLIITAFSGGMIAACGRAIREFMLVSGL